MLTALIQKEIYMLTEVSVNFVYQEMNIFTVMSLIIAMQQRLLDYKTDIARCLVLVRAIK